ncbi:hypothetical protein [Streptomyces sp. NPDC101455]|uniref:Pepco domain-containing protein n=1 Tax=Streptomyces sp. NPDC101455 TaxID=3366142 RepID=UPI0037FC07DC
MAHVTGLEVLVRAEEVTEGPGSGQGTKGFLRNRDGFEFATVQVRTEQLKVNIERTVEQLRSIFEGLAENSQRFPLTEVQVSFEVSAKGGIRLIGSSEIEGKGGITLVFSARNNSEA